MDFCSYSKGIGINIFFSMDDFSLKGGIILPKIVSLAFEKLHCKDNHIGSSVSEFGRNTHRETSCFCYI